MVVFCFFYVHLVYSKKKKKRDWEQLNYVNIRLFCLLVVQNKKKKTIRGLSNHVKSSNPTSFSPLALWPSYSSFVNFGILMGPNREEDPYLKAVNLKWATISLKGYLAMPEDTIARIATGISWWRTGLWLNILCRTGYLPFKNQELSCPKCQTLRNPALEDYFKAQNRFPTSIQLQIP